MDEWNWPSPDWIRWLNAPSVPLDVGASLSMGFEPQFVQEITWDDAGRKVGKWFHPAHTTDEGRARLQQLQKYFNTPHLPAHEIPDQPGCTREQRVRLFDLARFAVAQSWPIPHKLAQLLTLEPHANAEATPYPAAPVAVGDRPGSLNKIVHSTRVRRDTLTPVIEKAQKQCNDRNDTAEVWAALQVLAELKVAPLFGGTEDGLQYLEDGVTKIFKRKSLHKRLTR